MVVDFTGVVLLTGVVVVVVLGVVVLVGVVRVWVGVVVVLVVHGVDQAERASEGRSHSLPQPSTSLWGAG